MVRALGDINRVRRVAMDNFNEENIGLNRPLRTGERSSHGRNNSTRIEANMAMTPASFADISHAIGQ